MIRNLIKIILIISDAVNIGAVDISITYDESLFVVTDVADGDFDVTEPNLERNYAGTVRIVAFQMDNPGLNGLVTLASVTLAGDLDDLGSLDMTVNTLSDATPRCSPIDSTVDGFTIAASSPPSLPSTSTSSEHGGDGTYPPTSAPSLAISSATGTPVEEMASTPEQVPESRTEQPSRPPPISPPAAGIVIVAVAAIFGIVMVTRTTEDTRKATIATIGIVVVAVAATIGMMLIMA
jgi:hypothetical protein